MRYIRGFARFWWDFIIGDDWRVAAGIALALAVTKLLTSNGTNAWWLLPAAVAVLLVATVRRGARGSLTTTEQPTADSESSPSTLASRDPATR